MNKDLKHDAHYPHILVGTKATPVYCVMKP